MLITKGLRILLGGFMVLVVTACVILSGCGSGHSDSEATSPLPELHATQAGNVVTVNYRFSEDAKPPPKWILIKVSEAGGIPVGGNYPVHGNGGQVKIEVPFKGNRLVAIAQAVDLEGHSEIVETPVR